MSGGGGGGGSGGSRGRRPKKNREWRPEVEREAVAMLRGRALHHCRADCLRHPRASKSGIRIVAAAIERAAEGAVGAVDRGGGEVRVRMRVRVRVRLRAD